jgi:DNA-repair protein XRCC3
VALACGPAQATGGRALRSSGRRVMPALGLHWAHCVDTRLFLSRGSRAGALEVGVAVRRRLRVVFAPHLPPGEAGFEVTARGIHGVEEDAPPDSPTPD